MLARVYDFGDLPEPSDPRRLADWLQPDTIDLTRCQEVNLLMVTTRGEE